MSGNSIKIIMFVLNAVYGSLVILADGIEFLKSEKSLLLKKY